MPFLPVVATRFASGYTVVSGSGPVEIESLICWPSVTVDYGNEGSETEPPTRTYTGVIDYSDTNSASLGEGVTILLPLSNESIFEPEESTDDRVSVKWLNRWRRF